LKIQMSGRVLKSHAGPLGGCAQVRLDGGGVETPGNLFLYRARSLTLPPVEKPDKKYSGPDSQDVKKTAGAAVDGKSPAKPERDG
jgi:hypothetical protein